MRVLALTLPFALVACGDPVPQPTETLSLKDGSMPVTKVANAKEKYAFVYGPTKRGGAPLVCEDINQQGLNPVAIWVTGYFTGMNTAKYASVGQSTNTEGILGEVRFYCREHPSVSLIDAVQRVYVKIEKAETANR